MIPIPVALVTVALVAGIGAAFCVGLSMEISYLRRRNRTLHGALRDMARMENLNAKAFYAIMKELNQSPVRKG